MVSKELCSGGLNTIVVMGGPINKAGIAQRLDCGHSGYAQSPRCVKWEAPTVLNEAACTALSEVLAECIGLGRPEKDRMAQLICLVPEMC